MTARWERSLPPCDEGRPRHRGSVARSDERLPRGRVRLRANHERRARRDGVGPRCEGRLPRGAKDAPRSCRMGRGHDERGATPGLRGPRKRERRPRSEESLARRVEVLPWHAERGGRRGERLSGSCRSLPWCDERRPRNDGSLARFDQSGAPRGRGTAPRAEWRRIETDCAVADSESVAVHAGLSAATGAGAACCDEGVAKTRERLPEHFDRRARPSRTGAPKTGFRPRRKAGGGRGFRAGAPHHEGVSPRSSGGAPRCSGGAPHFQRRRSSRRGRLCPFLGRRSSNREPLSRGEPSRQSLKVCRATLCSVPVGTTTQSHHSTAQTSGGVS